MASIAVPKTLLSLLFLSLIPAGVVAEAAEATPVYRFGGWTLIAPERAGTEALTDPGRILTAPAEGLELLLYWEDGRQRAISLRFDGADGQQDAVVLKSWGSSRKLKGCSFGAGARLRSFKEARPKAAATLDFPEDGALRVRDGEHGLRRAGDVLVADLGNARVQLAADSPVVRLGEWNSADFCRFELKTAEDEDELS